MNEFEKSIINILEIIMEETSRITRLLASEHPDEEIRNFIGQSLHASFGLPINQSETLQATQDSLKLSEKQLDEN